MNDDTSEVSEEAGKLYSFFAAFGRGTLQFDLPEDEVEEIVSDIQKLRDQADGGISESELRSDLRERIRTGFLDNDHIDKVRSQVLGQFIIYYLMTSDAYRQHRDLGHTGLILEITSKGKGDYNFRTILAPGRDEVMSYCEQYRGNDKHIVRVTKEQVAQAAKEKKKGRPKDPSIEPPARPRPDRFIVSARDIEKGFGDDVLQPWTIPTLEEAPCFVFRSREVADGSDEEVMASLEAMAEYDRLHLPYGQIWVETKDWLEYYARDSVDGPDKEKVHLGIAATETEDGRILFQAFADRKQVKPSCCVLYGEIDKAAFAERGEPVIVHAPDRVDAIGEDEGYQRLITRAAGRCLTELLFLLSTSGVSKETVTGDQTKGGGKNKKKSRKRRGDPARSYTVIRVPYYFDTEEGAGDGSGRGRWKRPHVRRAHMWGKNTRPLEQQRWIEANLIGAARATNEDEIKRPEYVL